MPHAPPPVLAFTVEGPIVGLLALLLLGRVWPSRVTTSRISRATSIVLGMPSILVTILCNQRRKRLVTYALGRSTFQRPSHLARHFRLPSYQPLRLLASSDNNLQVVMLLKYKKFPLHMIIRRMISRPMTLASVEKNTCLLFHTFTPTTNILGSTCIRRRLRKGRFLGTPIVPNAPLKHLPRCEVAAVTAVEEEAAVVGEVVEEGLDPRPGAPQEEVITTMTGPSPQSQVVILPHCGQSWRPGTSRRGSLIRPGGTPLVGALKIVAVGPDLSRATGAEPRAVDEGCVLTALMLECYFENSLPLATLLTFLCSDHSFSLFTLIFLAMHHRPIVGIVMPVERIPRTLKIFAAIRSEVPRSRRNCANTTSAVKSVNMGTVAISPMANKTSKSRLCWSLTMVESLTLRYIALGSALLGLRPDHGGYMLNVLTT